jgi:plastocyanin
MHNLRPSALLAVFAVLLLGIAVLMVWPEMPIQPSPTATTTSTRIAPPSAAVIKQLQASHGFQAFVSYTSGSFQPATTTIKVGQTIRFTNNSSHDIWVGQITEKNTPEHPNTRYCDVPFNSCHALHAGDFAEFTFPRAGTYYFMDGLNTATRGAVVVK